MLLSNFRDSHCYKVLAQSKIRVRQMSVKNFSDLGNAEESSQAFRVPKMLRYAYGLSGGRSTVESIP